MVANSSKLDSCHMDVLEVGVHCSEMQGNIHIDLVAAEEI